MIAEQIGEEIAEMRTSISWYSFRKQRQVEFIRETIGYLEMLGTGYSKSLFSHLPSFSHGNTSESLIR